MAVDYTANSQRIICGSTNVPNDTDLTVMGVIDLDAFAGWGEVVSNSSKGSNPNPVGWTFGHDPGGQIQLTKMAVASLIATSLSLTANVVTAIACRLDEGTDGQFWMLESPGGSFTTQTVANTSAIVASTGPEVQLGNLEGINEGINGRLYSAAIYSGLLTAAEIERILRAMYVAHYSQMAHDSLVGLWVPNSTDAGGVPDLSGNGNVSTSNSANAVADHFGGPWFGVDEDLAFAAAAAVGGRIMSSLAAAGGLAGMGGIAGQGGGLAG